MAGSAPARTLGGLLRRPPATAPTDQEKDFIDEMIERLAVDGTIEFADPYWEGARYGIRHRANACPNIEVGWCMSEGVAWRMPCITCSGHWCEGHHAVADDRKWDLARTVLAAIFAGRRIEELSTGKSCSTHRTFGTREVSNRGQGSAWQEARHGRAAQPAVAGSEEVFRLAAAYRRVAAAAAETLASIRGLEQPPLIRPTDPTPVFGRGTLVIVHEGGQPPELQLQVNGARVYRFANGEEWQAVDGRRYRWFIRDNANNFGIWEV